MEVIIINNQQDFDINIEAVKNCAKYAASKFEEEPDNELNIVFTGKEEIRLLNKKYRSIDSETDVLSFSYMEESEMFGFDKNVDDFREEYGFFTIGEILICPGVAQDNIVEFKKNHSLLSEIIYLVIHGILHLFGYDHEKEQDCEKMENLNEEIFKEVVVRFNI